MNSSTPIKSGKADEELNLLLSKHPSKADLSSLLMELSTDERLRVLSYTGIVTKTPIQVRHELLRDARTQLSNRLIFIEAGIGKIRKQVASLQGELIQIQAMPTRFEITNVSLNDVTKYASAISKQLSDW